MTRDRMKQLLESADRYLIKNYKPQPIVLTRGEGCRLWDVAGNRYLDMTAGIAACPLGHGHPRLAEAIAAQAKRLIHVSNLYYIEAQIALAEQLAERARSTMENVRAFFCNSGGEANEAALKLAKRYQTTVLGRPERIEVLSFDGSFHGRTIATVGLTGQEKYRSGFGPLIEWGRFLAWPTAGDLSVLAQITERTCAVIVEPIQAEGGIRVPPPGFLRALRQRCSETGTVLIYDEVQTGVGRTGFWWGHQAEPDSDGGRAIAPDVMSLAKGLAGGVPIGAVLAREEVARGFAPGAHASTFGGNPLACAAACEVIERIDEDGLLENTRAMGEHLARRLAALCSKYRPGSAPSRAGVEVRGRGLLRGLALDGDAAPIIERCRQRGLLLSVAGGTVVRFAPALIVTASELDEAVDILDEALAG
jgi:acetylornithine aminotransferase/acetylornithine/N-succinyldiaminopimelate aminotransferase